MDVHCASLCGGHCDVSCGCCEMVVLLLEMVSSVDGLMMEVEFGGMCARQDLEIVADLIEKISDHRECAK